MTHVFIVGINIRVKRIDKTKIRYSLRSWYLRLFRSIGIEWKMKL